MSERDTRNKIVGYADAIADCIKRGYVSAHDGVLMVATYCDTVDGTKEKKVEGDKASSTSAENERDAAMQRIGVHGWKKVEGVGPHTDAGKVEGWACYFHWPVPDPWCERCKSATHHATHNTQVPESKGPDTTSHG